MSSGWTEQDVQNVLNRQKSAKAPVRGSKYRNQKVVVNGQKFDSKREAAYYQELLLREKAGEVRDIRRQVKFSLYCPRLDESGRIPTQGLSIWLVCEYFADFTFEEVTRLNASGEPSDHDKWEFVVVDVKGVRTAMYLMKRRWLELQNGIQIREVR